MRYALASISALALLLVSTLLLSGIGSRSSADREPLSAASSPPPAVSDPSRETEELVAASAPRGSDRAASEGAEEEPEGSDRTTAEASAAEEQLLGTLESVLERDRVRALLELERRAGETVEQPEIAARRVEAIAARVDDESAQVRALAVRVLGGYGASARSAVSRLAGSLRDPRLQRTALRALARLGAEAEEALPAVLALLREPMGRAALEREALRTAHAIDPDDPAVRSAMARALHSSTPGVRPTALALLDTEAPPRAHD